MAVAEPADLPSDAEPADVPSDAEPADVPSDAPLPPAWLYSFNVGVEFFSVVCLSCIIKNRNIKLFGKCFKVS